MRIFKPKAFSRTAAKSFLVLLLLTSAALLCFSVGLPPPVAEGRMTGGGYFNAPDGTRISHGFELHCNILRGPNNLQINWGPGNHFHMEFVTSTACFDHPLISPNPPNAPFDVHSGVGFGRLNGVMGARVEWVFTDAGEPGTNDQAALFIWDSNGTLVVNVPPNATLIGGNHQAHRETGH